MREFLAGETSNLATSMRQLLDRAVADAYIEGLRAGGMEAADMGPEEAQELTELIAAQMAHVKDFEKAAREARGDKDAEKAILARVDLWEDSIKAAGTAGLNAANAKELCEFELVGDESDESCTTCQRLLGKRHTRKYIKEHGLEIRPGNEKYECGCWNCPHDWVPVKKKKRG